MTCRLDRTFGSSHCFNSITDDSLTAEPVAVRTAGALSITRLLAFIFQACL